MSSVIFVAISNFCHFSSQTYCNWRFTYLLFWLQLT